jgi:hypothetical protein
MWYITADLANHFGYAYMQRASSAFSPVDLWGWQEWDGGADDWAASAAVVTCVKPPPNIPAPPMPPQSPPSPPSTPPLPPILPTRGCEHVTVSNGHWGSYVYDQDIVDAAYAFIGTLNSWPYYRHERAAPSGECGFSSSQALTMHGTSLTGSQTIMLALPCGT